MNRNIKLTIQYDGTDFWGYQWQHNGRTVQGELQKVLERITDSKIKLYAAGRTDSGVHATGQTANFHTAHSISLENIRRGANSLLPKDIAVTDVVEVPERFHSRFSAVSRTYIYSIHNSPVRKAFTGRYFLHYGDKLDIDKIKESLACLIGEKDFSSFRAGGDLSAHSIREVMRASVKQSGVFLSFLFEANAYLQHMIRNIMGTLLFVGRGRISPENFREILECHDRKAAGPSAPPHGLCLVNVRYPDDGIWCPGFETEFENIFSKFA